jgi:steroid 5-alpha reductase family enzyme
MPPFFAGGLAILALMTLLWLASLRLRDASIIDAFWGPGFLLAAGVYARLTEPNWLLLALVAVWALRLGVHIARRNWGRGEDFRYRQWRQEAGASWWWRSFFKVFLLQGALMWIISVPLLAAQGSGHSFGPLDALAACLWLLGFAFEALGDWQLARFRADPANKGRVLSSGLWAWTRHPNYFGDALQWWAFWLLAAAAGGWWSVFSPLLMTFLLRYVSGVDLMDKALAERKPGYAAYMRRTSAFLPWPPRRG